ncbi:hypothetical protein SDC9_210981 [bioreactor metagenome]|uniref:Uncharacterized protein n=1 Tax=bioreactor metagenome TaxID=1076179 RepID=A0A645JT83_9ZZZZ
MESVFPFVATLLESVGNVLQENQSEHHVHVVARIDVGAQSVGGGPQAFVEIVQVLLPSVVHI